MLTPPLHFWSVSWRRQTCYLSCLILGLISLKWSPWAKGSGSLPIISCSMKGLNLLLLQAHWWYVPALAKATPTCLVFVVYSYADRLSWITKWYLKGLAKEAKFLCYVLSREDRCWHRDYSSCHAIRRETATALDMLLQESSSETSYDGSTSWALAVVKSERPQGYGLNNKEIFLVLNYCCIKLV